MTSADHTSGLTILMIENEEVTACLLDFVLQKNGYRVIHSNNGAHAKKLISTMEPPNAILLETALPDTTGLDLLAYLRARKHWERTPVTMLTTGAENLDMRQAALLGANDYILKPVSPTRLAARLNQLLRDSHKNRARVA
jgi:DNA-binding response OmpR family regulator